MYMLEGRVAFDLIVNGNPFPLTQDTLGHLHIIQNGHNLLPVCEGSFLDSHGLFTQALQDSLTLAIMISPDYYTTNRAYHDFRTFNINSITPTRNGNVVTFSGILNALDYLRERPNKPISGTSSEAISQIASQCGLQAEVTGTNDSQKWLPNNAVSWGQWARLISDYGWSHPNSCMRLSMGGRGDGKWSLQYTDLTNPNQGPGVLAQPGLGPSGDNTYMITTFKASLNGGTLGTHAGYPSSVIDTDSGGDFDPFKAVDVAVKGVLGLSSSAMTSLTDGVRQVFMPPNNGNTHKNYAQAFNQNSRLRSTFSVILTAMTFQFTPFKVDDKVQVYLAKADGSLDETLSGEYIVNVRTQAVRKGQYGEKIQLHRQGLGQ